MSICSNFGSDGAQQPLAGFRRRHAAGGARQQPQAQPLFQTANGVAERGLRNPELCRCPREAAFPRHREEREEIIGVLSRH